MKIFNVKILFSDFICENKNVVKHQKITASNKNQASQVNDFSAFLCIGRCSSLGPMKLLLRYASWLPQASTQFSLSWIPSRRIVWGGCRGGSLNGGQHPLSGASQLALVGKNLPDSRGDIRDMGSIPGLGRSPGRGNGHPLQENPMNRQSQTWLSTEILCLLKRLATFCPYRFFKMFYFNCIEI